MKRVGVVQRFIHFSRKDLTVALASHCPYCSHLNERILKLSLEPEIVKCQNCKEVYFDSFHVKKDADEIRKILDKVEKTGGQKHDTYP